MPHRRQNGREGDHEAVEEADQGDGDEARLRREEGDQVVDPQSPFPGAPHLRGGRVGGLEIGGRSGREVEVADDDLVAGSGVEGEGGQVERFGRTGADSDLFRSEAVQAGCLLFDPFPFLLMARSPIEGSIMSARVSSRLRGPRASRTEADTASRSAVEPVRWGDCATPCATRCFAREVIGCRRFYRKINERSITF